jgi:hypothetical protein
MNVAVTQSDNMIRSYSRGPDPSPGVLSPGKEEFVIYRGKHAIARMLPGSPYMTATEAMADLYRTLPPEAAEGWVEESRIPGTIDKEMKDPWAT